MIFFREAVIGDADMLGYIGVFRILFLKISNSGSCGSALKSPVIIVGASG